MKWATMEGHILLSIVCYKRGFTTKLQWSGILVSVQHYELDRYAMSSGVAGDRIHLHDKTQVLQMNWSV